MNDNLSGVSTSTQRREESIDTAALMGATMTAVLAILIPKGPFDILSLPIGLTLVTIIVAYGGRRQGSPTKTLAFAASTSFALLLVVGPIIELVRQHGSKSLFVDHFLRGKGGDEDGLVDPWMIAVSWFVIGSSVCISDWLRQRPPTTKNPH